MKPGRHSPIYNFFKSQIEFGYLREGDSLPSIERLHEVYHVAVRTVRNAYLQLQKEGYISLCSGQNTTVIYHVSLDSCYQNACQYYLARKEAIQYLDSALKTFFAPLLLEGSRHLQEEGLQEVKHSVTEFGNSMLYLSFNCPKEMLLALNNRLILDFYYEIISFYQFYQFYQALAKWVSMEHAERHLQILLSQLTAACDQNDREELYRIFLCIRSDLDQGIGRFIIQAGREMPAPKQVPFEWNVFWQRPQLCYTLASRLIGRIFIKDEFTAGDYLPSYGKLKIIYSVSLSTVRRTMELMEQFGIVNAVPGLGIQVIPLTRDSCRIQHSAMLEIISKFLEAMQMIEIAFDSIVDTFYPNTEGNVETCISRLRTQQGKNTGFMPFFTILELLSSKKDNPAVIEIWRKLIDILLLGLPALQSQAWFPPSVQRLDLILVCS